MSYNCPQRTQLSVHLLINPLLHRTNQKRWIGVRSLSTMRAKTVMNAVPSVEEDAGGGAVIRQNLGSPELHVHTVQYRSILNLREGWKT